MKYWFLISWILVSLNVYAEKQLELNIGNNYSIKTEFLAGGERNYYIHLPSDYDNSNKEYPVLYILDGQMHFPSAVAIQHS